MADKKKPANKGNTRTKRSVKKGAVKKGPIKRGKRTARQGRTVAAQRNIPASLKTLVEALRQSEQRYKTIVENQMEYVDRYLPGGILTFVNDSLARMVGKKPEQLLGKTFYPFVHEADRKALINNLDSLTRDHPTFTSENRTVLPNGTERWQQWSHTALFDTAGTLVEYQSVGRDITERVQAVEALRSAVNNAKEEKAKTEAIIAAMGDAVSIQDIDYKILYQNQVSKDIYGDHVGECCHRAYQNRDEVCQRCHLSMAFADGKVHKLEQSRTTGNETRYYDITASPIRDFMGNIVAGIELVRDVTERKQTEEALRESKARFQAIFEQNNDGITVADLEGRYVMVNPAFCTMTGYSQEELRGMHVENLLSEKTNLQLFKQLSIQKMAGRREVELRKKDGSKFIAAVSGTILQIGERQFVHGIVQDVTGQKQVEKEVLESRSTLKHVLDTVPQSIFWKDRDGVYLGCNQVFARAAGFDDPNKIIGKTDFDLWPRAEADAYRADDREVVQTVRAKRHIVEPLLQADGSRLWIDTTKEPLVDKQGKVYGILGVFDDITESKRTEDRLTSIMKAVESASDAIGISDAQGHHFYQNKALSGLFGYANAEELEAAGGGPAVVKDPEVAKEMFDAIMHGRSWAGELEMVTKSGRIFPAFERADAIKDNEGNIIGLIGIITDITERKLAEESLLYFQMAVGSSTDAVGMSTPEGRHFYQNEAFTRLFGLSVSEVDGIAGPPTTVYADENVGRKIFDTIKSGGSFAGEVKMFDRERKVRDIYLQAYPAKNKAGKVVCLVGVHNDITERKQAEVALQKREKQLAESQRIGQIGSWEHNPRTGEIFWSDELFRLLGLDPAKHRADFGTFFSRIHPDDQPALKAAVEASLRERKPFDLEYRFIVPGEPVKIIHARADLVPDAAGDLTILSGTAQDITERKQTENDLALFRNLIDKSNEAIFVNDPRTGRFIDVNDKACSSLGYDRAELLNIGVRNIESNFPEDLVWQDHVDEVRKRGFLLLEGSHRKKDGAVFPVETSVSFAVLGDKEYMIAFVRDITERKQAGAALRESEQRYHSLFDQSPDGIVLIDTNGKILEFNDKAHLQLGYTREEFSQFSLSDIDPVESPEEIQDHIRKHLETDKMSFDVKHRTKQGEVRDVNIISQVVTLSGKQVMYAIWHDITDRKQVEDALSISEGRYRSLFEDSPISLWEEDIRELQTYFAALRTSGVSDFRAHFTNHPEDVLKCVELVKVVSVNKSTLAMYEASDQTTLLRSLSRVFTTQSFEAFQGIMIALAGGEKVYECEAINQTLTGRPINVLLRWSLLVSDLTPQHRALISIVDITNRKVAEEKIRQSEEFNRNILDTVDEGFIVIDKDFRILTANKAYCGQVGKVCGDIIGKHCYEVSHRTSRPCSEEGEECAVRQVFATGEPHSALHKHMDLEGNVLYVETKGFPIKDAGGYVTSVIETINNITEKHLLEEERLKTQKLESIGTLAGGIAHDFNNLLQGIFGYISMAKMTIDRRDKSLAMLEQAENALHQSVNLTTQLLTFSKGGKPVKKLIDLRLVIESAAKFTLSGSRSDFHMHIPVDLWQTEADGGQIGQVIQNIVLNADQAMPVGGSVMVTAMNMKEGDGALPAGLARGNYILIAIRDTGIGIPEQYLDKIFDPYFTTKEKGSGLGLATSYSIVRNHGGLIDVSTKPGEGSTFTIYLPASVGADKTESAAGPQALVRSKKARILVMDDEEIIRSLSRELLDALGHEVDVADHGQEALEKYQRAMAAGEPFDIVILDLTVRGGMGGADTVQKLLEIDPAVKAIVSSGYSDDTAIANYVSCGFKAYLKKPYDIDQLREVISSLLS